METIEIDSDTRQMLNELKEFYGTDDGHILRALLRERIKRINEHKKL